MGHTTCLGLEFANLFYVSDPHTPHQCFEGTIQQMVWVFLHVDPLNYMSPAIPLRDIDHPS